MSFSFVKCQRWLLPVVLFSFLPGLFAQGPVPGDDPGTLPEGNVPPPDAAPFIGEGLAAGAISSEAPELVSIPGAWSPQGPGPISGGQVEGMTNKFVCGAIHAVITHPTDPNIVYIGAVNGGVWKTTNATAASPTWTTTTSDMPSLSIGALAFDPLDATSQTVWAGTGRFSSYGRIGGSRAGLLKTTDGGASWTVVTGGGVLNGKNISGIVVRGNTILVSVNAADASGNTNLGVWRSTNGGSTFTQMAVSDGTGATGLPAGVSYDIVSSPAAPDTVYTCIAIPTTASTRGIYKSTDLGATWTRVSTTAMNNRITSVTSNIEMSVGNVNNVVLGILESGAPVGIYHSADAGATWQEMDYPTMPVTSATVFNVTGATNASPIVITTSAAHGYSSNNYVEIAGVTGNTAANGLHQITVLTTTTFSLDFSTGNGAYVSGGTARRVTSMNPRGSKGPEEGAPEEIAGGQGSIHFAILAHPSNPNLLFTGGDRQDLPFPNYIGAVDYSGNLWRGDASIARNGLSPSSQWRHLTHSNSVAGIPGGGTSNNSSPHADCRDMSIDANGQLVEVDDGGIFRRTSPETNTGAWTSMAGNLQITEIHSIVYDTVSNIIITGNQDNGTSVQNTTGSLAYTAVSTADGGDVAAAPNPANPSQSIRYSSFQNLGSFRRRVMSGTNTLVSQNFPALSPQGGAPAISGQFVTPIEINAVNANRLLIGASNGVYESLDQGATVSRISTLGPNDGLNGGRTMSYGGRKNGIDNPEVVYFGDSSSVYRRVAAGDTPVAVAGYVGSTVRGLIVDPEDHDHLFVIDNNQVFRSIDGGTSFTDITGDIPASAKDFRCLEFIRNGADWAVVVGTLRGVHAANSAAPTDWGLVGTDLPIAYVWDMDYDAADNVLVVGTLGRGAWKFSDARSIIVGSTQTITFAPITDKITTDTFTLSATGGGSGNPVTFAVTSGPAVIGSGNLVSFTGAGSVTITASQAGNATYLAAEDVSRTFTVTKATATVSLAPLAQTYNGSARTVTATTNPPSLPVTITYDNSPTAPINAGNYPVIGTINHSIYQGSKSETLVVAKAPATVTLSGLNQVYDGGPKPVGVTTTPGGLSFSLTYNGSATVPSNAGTYPVVATITAPNHQGSASGSLVISQASQTITFPPLADAVATDVITLAATGGFSGNPVTYTVTEGPGQITGGNQLSFTGAGLVRVVASQAGNANYLAAVPVDRSLTVTKTMAQIQLTGLSPVYNGSPQGAGIATVPAGLGYNATYGGSSTLPTEAGTYPLSVTINDPRYQGTAAEDFVIQKAVAEVTLTGLGKVYTGSPQGAGATTVPSGLPVVFTYDGLPGQRENAGSYTVVATIDHPSVEGSASGTFVIAKAPQSIGFAPIDDQFATETVVLMASGGGSNNPILFEVVEGSATISGGNLLTFSSEGTVSVRASQAGDANHLDAVTVTRSFEVTKFPATLTLLNLTQSYTGTPRQAGYSTSPGNLNVALSYGVENYGDLSGAPVLPGTYLVLGVIDEPYYRGDAGGSLTITKGVQTIDFPAIPPQSATAAVTLAATGGPSGNPVIYEIESGPGAIEGNELTFTASGTVVVRATQAGDDLYAAATPVSRTVTVTKAPATIDLSGLSQTYDGQPRVPVATTTPPGLSVAFTYDGLPDAPAAAGSYAVVATIGDPRYEGSDSDTLVVAKAAQVIDFPPLADALATATVPLSASGGGSGNPVTFVVTAGPASLQGGNTLVFSGAGEVGITASQAGDANHLAATPVERTFTVRKAPAPALTLSALRQVFDGSPREVVVTTQPAGLASLVTYEGGPTVPVATGSYAVVATLDDPIYEGSVGGTLVVDDPARLDLVPGGSLPALSALGAIEVATFSLGRYEVTWGLWKQVRDWAVQNGYDLAAIGAGCEDDHPVRGVNWFEAVKWCNARTEWENATLGSAIEPAYRVGGSVYRTGQPATAAEVEVRAGTSGYRLPTPGEREFAARGGRLSAGHPYPGGVNAGALAWHAANSAGAACDLSGGRGTRAAGGLLPNELGIHDLAGNVSEWTGGSLTSTPAQQLVGGGDWDAPAAALLHSALDGAAPADRSDRVGFRIARSVAAALAAAVDNEQLPWESGGDTPWYAQTGDHTDGIDAAAIGALAGEENAWVETTVTGPGNVAFSWKIQLPAGTGSLRVTLDGEPRGVISGATGWAASSVYVPPGTHLVRWTYERSLPPQGTTPDPVAGPNGAWLDAVAFTDAVAPTVITGTVGDLGDTSGTVGGTVSSDGGAPVETRGIVVSTGTEPVLGQDPDFAAPSAGTGDFVSALTGLAPGTTYRARAYASNAAGTGYGATILFTTDETIDLSGGTATRDRTIEAGDRQVFHFTLAGPRHALFTATGGAALRAALYDGSGGLIVSFDGDGDFSLGDLLYAGSYELHVHRTAGAGAAQDYTLAFDAATVAETLPDVGVGVSALVQTGVGIQGGGAGQVLSLGSRKAVAVRGVATFRNGGTLPDELILSGSGGSALFAVAYLGEGGNVTAQMLAGTLRTPVLEEGDEAVAVQVSVVPNRKKLSKKKKGKRTVTLKRTHVLSIRAVSDFDPAITDQAAVVVRTY